MTCTCTPHLETIFFLQHLSPPFGFVNTSISHGLITLSRALIIMEANLQPEEELHTNDNSGDITRGSLSQPSSGYLTPPQTDTRERPRKKHVAWKPSDATSSSRPRFLSPENRPSQEDLRSNGRRKLSNQETEEDLRRALQKALSQEAEPPTASSRKKKPGVPSIHFEDSPRPNRKPKSALRGDNITPPSSGSPRVNLAGNETPEDLSALQARDKANRLQEHLVDATEEELNTSNRQEDQRRWSRGSFRNFYHDRDDDFLESGQTTPGFGDDHVPQPSRFRLGGLSAQHLLSKLTSLSTPSSRAGSRAGSRANSPERSATEVDNSSRSKRPGPLKSLSEQDLSQRLSKIGQKLMTPKRKHSPCAADLRIKKHVQETLTRQRYILLLCRCLMFYGAPTHRLEDYLKITSRILETEAQFLYLPGCMIVSFDDSNTHTAEVKLVKESERVDLGKLRETHDVYKLVVHDEIGVEEAIKRLDQIRGKPKKFKLWFLIVLHGVASATVSPWAYQGRPIDLPIAFFLGCLLGFLRLFWAAKSDLYSAVFEIASVAITSFLSRAFGSINGGNLFCFSTLASSSITLILPGYTILCAALELQSRSIVAGSVRMVYALVYSLFIGFSLTIGTALYGIMDKHATSSPQCENPMPAYWAFFFVPVFTFCLMVINQAKWKQMPLMLVIAFAGYIVSFFSARAFSDVSAVSSGLAAIAISVMANIYNRVGARLEGWVGSINAKIANKFFKQENDQPAGSLVEPDLEKGEAFKDKTTGEDAAEPYTYDEVFANEKERDLQHESGASTPDAHRNDSVNSESSPNGGTPQEGETINNSSDQPKARVNYSLAASAMLPAIFVLVPSGLSIQGSLVQGIFQADQITNITTKGGNSTNGTGIVTSSQLTGGANDLQNGLAFSVGYSVIQIAIGITVGLFIGALIAYPFGKGGKWTRNMRSGLFSF